MTRHHRAGAKVERNDAYLTIETVRLAGGHKTNCAGIGSNVATYARVIGEIVEV
jgi:hypothetical protein